MLGILYDNISLVCFTKCMPKLSRSLEMVVGRAYVIVYKTDLGTFMHPLAGFLVDEFGVPPLIFRA